MFARLGQYRGLLITYLKPQKARVMLLAALLLGSIGLQLANPQVVGYFVDETQRGAPQSALLLAAVAFIVIALAQRVVALAAVYVGENVGWSATNALRSDLAHHCVRLDMPFHKTRTPGELIERIDGDVTLLANFFSQLAISVAGNTLLVLGILILLFREDWRVGAGLALYTLLTFLILGGVQKIAVRRWVAARQARAEQYGFLEERIAGAEDIRASGAEAYVMERLDRLTRASLLTSRVAYVLGNLTSVGTTFLTAIGYALGLALGAYLYTQHQVSIGAAYLVVYYIGMVAAPLESIRKQADDLQQATAGIERIQALLALQPAVQETVRATLPPGRLAVEFQDVCFRYEEHDQTLSDISFRLEPGQTLGLLGRTGSGKTTLTRLLFRLYDPAAGAIRLDGLDLRELALADLRERVGMVTQDVQLFQASIRDNLTFFDEAIGDDSIERALDELGLWPWYQALPSGLDTPLGPGGHGLSAGQAQLLAFARVFLKDPGLVILDEASSRLDPATERLLERAVDRLLAQRTGIIIAHRLRTVQRADTIMILEHGRIVEYGPREELAYDPTSRFYSLLQTGLETREEMLV